MIVKWVGRLLALMMLAFGLMFYFGYGNPLPFIDPEYTWLENAWLTLIPMVFIGLAAGWKYEKLGGFLVIIPLLLGSVFAFIAGEQPPSLFAIVLIPAILYLIVGYSKTKILH
ncbi:MAG: hypothetical protein COC24_005100 [Alphaproteobacteria bacterium]|nr:hypothetical protein [Alphaproteobacteria bacterium]